MRLVCPKCAAEYQVDDSAIPVAGRDVQCANCGDTWFQAPNAAEPVDEPVVEVEPAAPVAEEAPVTEPEPSPEPVPEQVATPVQEPVQEAIPEPAPMPARPDRAILEILRREAAHEENVVSDDEVAQPEPEQVVEPEAAEETVAASDPEGEFFARKAIEAQQRHEAMRQQEQPEAPEDVQEPVVEPAAEIAAGPVPETVEVAQDETAVAEPKRSSGYRLGFFLAMFLALVLLAGYLLDDQIVEALPESSNFMASYVETIDGLRVYLDRAATSITAMISGLFN